MDYIFKDLVTAAKQDDKDAMETLLIKLKPLIMSNIRKYVFNDRLEGMISKEDLIQDCYIRIMQCVYDFDQSKEVPFLGYVKMQMRYFFLDYCKGKKVSSLSLDQTLPGNPELTLLDSLVDQSTDVQAIVEENEAGQRLSRALRTLTNAELEVLHLHFYCGMKMSEISAKLGIPYHRVNQNKKHALAKLKNSSEFKQFGSLE